MAGCVLMALLPPAQQKGSFLLHPDCEEYREGGHWRW